MKKEEDFEQRKVVQHLEIYKKQGKILFFFSVANGGSRNMLEAINLKKQGVRAGVSDLCVILKDKVLFIEMKKLPKKLKSGKLSYSGISVSESQIEFINIVNSSDVVIAKVCYGYFEAIDFIDSNL